MKNATSIQLEKTWWTKEQPKNLAKSATPFQRALENFTKANAALAKDTGPKAVKDFQSALDDLLKKGKDVEAECTKLLRSASDKAVKQDLSNTISVMKKPLAAAVNDARLSLELQSEKDDDEKAAAGSFADPKAHAEFLQVMLKRLKNRNMNFAVGLPSPEPEAMRFNFHLTKNGPALARQLRQEAGAKQMTFGVAGMRDLAEDAGQDAEAGTLYLKLEGRMLSGLAKRTRAMFKKLGVTKVRKVEILDADGKVLESADDSTDDSPLKAENLAGDQLKDAKAAVEAALKSQNTPKDKLLARLNKIEGYINENLQEDKDPWLKTLEQIRAVVAEGKLPEGQKATEALLKKLATREEKPADKSDAPASDRAGVEALQRKIVATLDQAFARLSELPYNDVTKKLFEACGGVRAGASSGDLGKLKDVEADANKVMLAVEKAGAENREVLLAEINRLSGQADSIKAISDPQKKAALTKSLGEIRSMLSVRTANTINDARKLMDQLDFQVFAARVKELNPVTPRPVDSKSAVAAMHSVPFLDGVIKDKGAEKTNPQGQKVTEHMAKAMDNVDKLFAANPDPKKSNAMKMLVMIQTASKQMVRDSGQASSITPTFSKKILQYHGDDILKALAAQPGAPDEAELRQSLQLAMALASDDPMTPFMEKEVGTGDRKPSLEQSAKIRFEDAVARIRDMAEKGGVVPSEMADMLSMLHQAEVGSFSWDEIVQGKNVNKKLSGAVVNKFDVAHVGGELAPDYVKELLAPYNKDGTPQWDANGLKYSDMMTAKLGRLKTEVAKWDTPVAPDGKTAANTGPALKPDTMSDSDAAAKEAEARKAHAAAMKLLHERAGAADAKGESMREATLSTPTGSDYVPPVGLDQKERTPDEQGQFVEPLTDKQYAFLRSGIRDELDATLDDPDENPAAAKVFVKDFLVDVYGYEPSVAEQLFDKCKTFLESVPLTITLDAGKTFGADGEPAFSKDYMSTQVRNKDLQSDADLFGVSPASVTTGKGDENRTRMDKSVRDYRNWTPGPNDDDRGEQYARWRQEKDERETGGNQFMPDESAVFGGVNINMPRTSGGRGSSYGYEHVVLDPAVRQVSTFCFTTAGKERRDMSMILADMVANKTGREYYIPMILNNATKGGKTFNMSDLDLEFHCYGPIDLTKDVREISVPSEETLKEGETDTDAARKQRRDVIERVKLFCAKTGLPEPTEWKEMSPDEQYAVTDRGAKERDLDIIKAEIFKIDPKANLEMFNYELARTAFYRAKPTVAGADFDYNKLKTDCKAALEAFKAKYKHDKAMAYMCKDLDADFAKVEAHHARQTKAFNHPNADISSFVQKANVLSAASLRLGMTSPKQFDDKVGELAVAYAGALQAVKTVKDLNADEVRDMFKQAVTRIAHINKYNKIEDFPVVKRWKGVFGI